HRLGALNLVGDAPEAQLVGLRVARVAAFVGAARKERLEPGLRERLLLLAVDFERRSILGIIVNESPDLSLEAIRLRELALFVRSRRKGDLVELFHARLIEVGEVGAGVPRYHWMVLDLLACGGKHPKKGNGHGQHDYRRVYNFHRGKESVAFAHVPLTPLH